MTFCSDQQDKSKIISKVSNNGNKYTVTYLDNTETIYYSDNESHMNELESEMLEQAIERDYLMYESLEEERRKTLMLLPLSIIYKSLQKEESFMKYIALFIAFYSLRDLRKINKQLNELKKYRILIKYYQELKENPSLNKLIHFETIYYNDIDIFSIDEYTLYDMKTIKKELIHREKITEV